MATSAPVPEKMDLETLSHVVSLRQREGLHIDYQYGLRVGGDHDWSFNWPDPKYKGCSLRFFIYNRVDTYQKLRVGWKGKHTKYFCAIELTDKRLSLTYGDGSAGNDTSHPTKEVPLGTFFSIGARLDRNLIRPLINDWVGSGYDMGTKAAEIVWFNKLYTGENYIVSLHLCDEVGGSFPSDGLRQVYFFKFVLPIGSYVTVFAVFTGGTTGDQKEILIGLDGKNTLGIYPDTTLKPNEEFRITVSNTFGGWVLATSFSGDTQDPERIPQKAREKEEFTNVSLSNNCYIRRILAVCGPIPEKYRKT